MRIINSVICIFFLFSRKSESAKILALFLTPIQSHNLAVMPLIQELIKRGHEITVIAVDPIFSKGKAQQNMTEIDMHHISYEVWTDEFKKYTKGNKNPSTFSTQKMGYTLLENLFAAQCKSDQIQKFVNDKSNKFDLIIYDATNHASILFSHIYKTPVIPINCAMLLSNYDKILGITGRTQYYVNYYRQTIKKLTFWETCVGLYEHFSMLLFYDINQKTCEDTFKKTLSPISSSISELYNNIQVHLVNVDTIWDGIFPITSNVFTLGHLQKKPIEGLPKDIQTYLDSSKNGVIYISFGTNVFTPPLPPEVMNYFIEVISEMPYDVLWKWEKDEMLGKPENVRLFMWLPQADVLGHPKIKLFITQAGLHSTEEAIHAGVPFIGIPRVYDQIANAERYVYHGIGKKLDLNTLTKEEFKEAIETVINNASYTRNVINLGKLLEDKPLSSMEKAIWAIEYVLRHGGAQHMRSPASNLSWAEYFEVELMCIITIFFVTIICMFVYCLLILMKFLARFFFTSTYFY